MADTKISAMTSAATVLNADQIPIVTGGVNKRASKSAILSAAPGEPITIQGVAGQDSSLRNAGGTAVIYVTSAAVANVLGANGFFIGWPGFAVGIGLDGLGAIHIVPQFGAQVVIAYPAVSVGGTFDTSTGQIVFVASNGMTCPYLDGTGGAWAFAPAHYNLAINRLAIALAGLLGGPVP
jgi:hypothetical protein